MPNYNQSHAFYAGVDLHARSMFVHILNTRGKAMLRAGTPARCHRRYSNIYWNNVHQTVAARRPSAD